MTPFLYERATNQQAALSLAAQPNANFLGGGTNLVDLMRETIAHPTLLVDVTGLSREIEEDAKGGLKIGAGVKNTAAAADRRVREQYPLMAQAILAGASAQIRNMATVGGNILQRTRCAYFYDNAARCNKRAPGAGCDAVHGFNRNHAILGASPSCVATHPSDMCVALVALDATVSLAGPRGLRDISIADLHRLPGDSPEIDTEVRQGELITAITLRPNAFAARSSYRKVRDRASYAFALVSVAAALELDGDRIKEARLALGGVAHKPWRVRAAEEVLKGRPADEASFREAAEAALAEAKGLRDNAFKIDLAKRVIVDSFLKLTSKETTR